jgi:hypothetical protein
VLRVRLYFSRFGGRPRSHRLRTFRLPIALLSEHLGRNSAGECQTRVICLQFNLRGKRLAHGR